MSAGTDPVSVSQSAWRYSGQHPVDSHQLSDTDTEPQDTHLRTVASLHAIMGDMEIPGGS